jgi:hypothetical protein
MASRVRPDATSTTVTLRIASGLPLSATWPPAATARTDTAKEISVRMPSILTRGARIWVRRLELDSHVFLGIRYRATAEIATHATRRSPSTCRNHPSSWFQLVKIWVSYLWNAPRESTVPPPEQTDTAVTRALAEAAAGQSQRA